MSEPARIRAELGEAARIVFVSGNFNVLHPGHARFLEFARDQGDHLVIGVTPDGHPGATIKGALRLEGVRGNRHVTHSFLMEMPVARVVSELRPQIVVKGREHEDWPNPEADAVGAYGGRLVFSSGDMLRTAVSAFEERAAPLGMLPQDFMARRGISKASLTSVLAAFPGQRVLVVGDLIVDDYVDCDPLGMSQEDPTIVVTPIERRRFVGGAGIVAGHGAGLGAEVTLISVVGEDAVAGEARDRLGALGLDTVLLEDPTRPTTLKERYRAAGKTLLRVSHLRQHAISLGLAARVRDEIVQRLAQTDLILFSDFNYGCLPTRLVDEITALARGAGVMMAADSQASSQISDISRFRGMQLITPTELEARLALNDQASNLVVCSEALINKAEVEHVVMTLGANGVLIRTRDGLETDRIAALNGNPRDVAGAGDSLFCAASLALTAGADIWHAALLGSLAAAHQVGRIGNQPLSAAEIALSIQEGEA